MCCTFSRCSAYGSFRKMLCRVPESSVTRRLPLPWLSGSLLGCLFALRWPETSISRYPNFESVFKFCPVQHGTHWGKLPESLLHQTLGNSWILTMRAVRSSTYLHADTALQVYKRCQSAALVFRKVDPCFLEIVLQGVPHPQRFGCVPLYTPVVTHSPCCKASDCAVVLVKGPYQMIVQLLIDVQFVYISCISTLLIPAACPTHACKLASRQWGPAT